MKNVLMFIGGFILLVFGMALVLRHWTETVIVWEGVAPSALAVAGLVVMFAASIKR